MPHVTVKLLVAGLAAIVPSDGGNKVQILVPKVDQTIDHQGNHFIPRHETWFGYWIPPSRPGEAEVECRDNWKQVPVPAGSGGGKTCWYQLTKHIVTIPAVHSPGRLRDPSGRDNFITKDDAPDEGEPEEIKDF